MEMKERLPKTCAHYSTSDEDFNDNLPLKSQRWYMGIRNIQHLLANLLYSIGCHLLPMLTTTKPTYGAVYVFCYKNHNNGFE